MENIRVFYGAKNKEEEINIIKKSKKKNLKKGYKREQKYIHIKTAGRKEKIDKTKVRPFFAPFFFSFISFLSLLCSQWCVEKKGKILKGIKKNSSEI